MPGSKELVHAVAWWRRLLLAVIPRGWARLLLLQLLGNLSCSFQVCPPLIGGPSSPSCASCWGAAEDGYVFPLSPLFQRDFNTLTRSHTLSIKFEGMGRTRGHRGGGMYCTLWPLLLLLTTAGRCPLLLLPYTAAAGSPTPSGTPLRQRRGFWSRGGGGSGTLGRTSVPEEGKHTSGKVNT